MLTPGATRLRSYWLFPVFFLALALVGCDGFFTNGGGGGGQVCGGQGGFSLVVVDQNATTGVVTGTHSGATITASDTKDLTGVQGCVSTAGNANTPVNPLSVPGGRAPAQWTGSWKTFDLCTNGNWTAFQIQNVALHSTATVGGCNTTQLGSRFLLTNSLPSTLTVSGTGFTSSHGMPQLRTFSVANALVSTSLASSVAADGASATFNFPKNSDGSALRGGEYGYVLSNQNPAGTFTDVGADILSLGTADTSSITPYGVDAAHEDISVRLTGCFKGCPPPPPTPSFVFPAVTLFSSNTLKIGVAGKGNGIASIPVGTQPVAVKLYRYQTWKTTEFIDPETRTTTTTGPTRAIVANFGSNTVSVIDAVNNTAIAAVSVGIKPVGLLVKSDSTKAYVANYGSATVSEVDLTANTQPRVVNVGANPTSLAIDPGGSAFWVGGLNYISKIDMTTFGVVSTVAVNGQVTSLSTASGQNAFVYTVVNGNTFMAQHSSITSGGAAHIDYQLGLAQGSAYSQSAAAPLATGIPGWMLVGGPLVSAAFGNRYVVEGTPTGFLVYDLQSNTALLQGPTPSVVRGIATDAQDGTVYVTSPDTNTLTTIPLPPIQTN